MLFFVSCHWTYFAININEHWCCRHSITSFTFGQPTFRIQPNNNDWCRRWNATNVRNHIRQQRFFYGSRFMEHEQRLKPLSGIMQLLAPQFISHFSVPYEFIFNKLFALKIYFESTIKVWVGFCGRKKIYDWNHDAWICRHSAKFIKNVWQTCDVIVRIATFQ